MEEFASSVVKFLEFNEYKVLQDKGKISREQAEKKALDIYREFNKIQPIESDFDTQIKEILESSKKDKKK